MLNISKENKFYGRAYLIQNFVFCTFFSFLVPYLKNSGYNEAQIGTIISLTLIITTVSQPFIGYLSDNHVPLKKLYLISSFAMLILGIVLPLVKQNYVLLMATLVLASLTGRSTNSMLDSFIMNLSTKRSGLDFGFTRGVGSFGFAICAMFTAFLMDKFGDVSTFYLHTIFSVLLIVNFIKAENSPMKLKSKNNSENTSFIKAMKILFKNKEYTFLIFATTILYCAVALNINFTSLIILKLGGTNSNYGLSLSIAAFSEVPAMWNFYRLLKYATVNRILVFAFFAYLIRYVIVLLFPNVTVVILTHLLQAFSFGLFTPALMRRMQQIVPVELFSSANFLGASIYSGVGSSIALFAGGYILKDFGYLAIFGVSAILAFIAFTLMLINEIKISKIKKMAVL